MSDWADVAKADEIPPGGSKVVYLDGAKIAVFNLGGQYYAIEDVCTHDGGDLDGGTVEGEEIVCPRHGARFNIKTGAVTAPPAYEPVYSFPLRVHDGTIQIRDDRWN